MPKPNKKLEGMTVAAGQRWTHRGYGVRIVGVAEGYVVYRRKGCGPSLMYFKDFEKAGAMIAVARPLSTAVVE